jgi:hypothetical protein
VHGPVRRAIRHHQHLKPIPRVILRDQIRETPLDQRLLVECREEYRQARKRFVLDIGGDGKPCRVPESGDEPEQQEVAAVHVQKAQKASNPYNLGDHSLQLAVLTSERASQGHRSGVATTKRDGARR